MTANDGAGLKILLADDMAHFLDLELSFLRRADCRILTAADGAQALVLAKQEQPDLLLLDIEMPRMSGIEVCRLLRQDPRFAETPIVMVTSTQRQDEARQAGATDFWRKPIKESEFLAGVQKLVPIAIREDQRLAIGLPVQFQVEGGAAVEGMTRDLSTRGAFVLGDAKVQPGASIALDLSLGFDNAPALTLTGHVVRVQQGEDGGLGVAFDGPPDALDELQAFLREQA